MPLKLLLTLLLLALPLQAKTIQLGVWEESSSFRISGAHGEAEFGKIPKQVAASEAPKEAKSHPPVTKNEEYPLKNPCIVHLPVACPLQESAPCSIKRPCCSDLGFGAGAVVVATAAAGMLIPDCKTDPDAPMTPLPETLQFNIRYLCGEIAGTPTAEIVLPSMVVFQTYGVGAGQNPSAIIFNPTAGTYTVNVNGIDNDASCFVVDVIAGGVTVISGAPFSGTAPNITFNYTL